MKRILSLFFLSVILVSIPVNLFSQGDDFVFAPFVSRFKAIEENSSIRLTWKDSRDIDGSYLIYRHTELIGRQNFSDAFLISEVKAGTELYIDSAIPETEYYYAIIGKNVTGEVYELLIPYRNITIQPAVITAVAKIADTAASIRYLRVVNRNESLVLTFESSPRERELAVLRNLSPIFTTQDLTESTLLGIIPGRTGSYTDFPIPGVPYFYAVLDAELLKTFSAELTPFENTTLAPAEVPISLTADETARRDAVVRQRPLPGLIPDRYIGSGIKFESLLPVLSNGKYSLSVSTEKTVQKLIKENPGLDSFFPEKTLINPDDFYNSNEDIRLTLILEKYFFPEHWKELEKSMLDFIRSADRLSVKNKGRFYLGQAYFFQNKLDKAAREFILASDNYYPESREWFEKIFNFKLVRKDL